MSAIKLDKYITTGNCIIAIILIGFIVYANSLLNKFVWDDVTLVHQLANWSHQNFFTLLFQDKLNQYYRPFSNVAFTLIYYVAGESVFLYHFLQITIHIVNALMVFFLFRKFLNISISFILATIFVVHPINIESVSYISILHEVGAVFFGLVALHITAKQKASMFRISFCAFLLLSSLLFKETGAIFLILVPLFHKVIHKRFALWPFVVSGGAGLFYFFLRLINGKTDLVGNSDYIPIVHATIGERLLTVPKMVGYYLKAFLFPDRLIISQYWVVKQATFNDFFLPLLVCIFLLLILTILFIYFWKSKSSFFWPYILFSVLFLTSLGMHLQIIPLDMTVADRWFYLPCIGLLGIIGLGLEAIRSIRRKVYIGFLILLSISIPLLGLRTITRNFDWKDAFRLYTHDIKYEDNFNINHILAYEYIQRKDFDSAQKYLEKSVQQAPGWWANWVNLGAVYEAKGEIDKAIKANEVAMKNNPHFEFAVINLAVYKYMYKNPEEAKGFITNEGIKNLPNNPILYYFLAASEYKLKNKDVALKYAQKAYELLPNDGTQQLLFAIENDQPIK